MVFKQFTHKIEGKIIPEVWIMLWLIAFIFSGDIVRPPMQCNGVANDHDTMGLNNL